MLLAASLAAGVARAAAPSTADVDAAARAEGNRRPVAVAIGRALFVTPWPAQILKVRVDGVGSHDVAGIVVSAAKFHRPLTLPQFDDEIERVVRTAFAASSVEEVDVEVDQPLHLGEHVVVSGDFAQPSVRIVYTATVERSQLPQLASRIAARDGVFVSPAFATALGGAPAPAEGSPDAGR